MSNSLSGGDVQVQDLTLLIYSVGTGRPVWPRFREHHYMAHTFTAHRAWIVALPDGEEVALTSSMRLPHGHLKNAWREHRTVVLPDYQGLGIGARISDWVGEHIITMGIDGDGVPGRYYSRTVHPRLGLYRNASDKWRPTASNEKVGAAPNKGISKSALVRWSYSHEYVGEGGNAKKARKTRANASPRRPREPVAPGAQVNDTDVLAALAARLG